MKNAKSELLEELVKIAVNSNIIVKCAQIKYKSEIINLPINYSQEQFFSHFLNQLDFDYNESYGNQELFGIVWLSDDSWLERKDYDGLEEWEYKKLPIIPNELK